MPINYGGTGYRYYVFESGRLVTSQPRLSECDIRLWQIVMNETNFFQSVAIIARN